MTYIVEINYKTSARKKSFEVSSKATIAGTGLLYSTKKGSFKYLTAEEMVLPGGGKLTDEQLEEFFGQKGYRKKLNT